MVEIFREVKRVLRDDGQCFIVIGDSRTKDRQWCGVPWKLVFALQADGWRWEDEIIWQKPSAMPGSQRNRCTRSHEIILHMNKSRNAYYDMEAIREPQAQSTRERAKYGWTGRTDDLSGGARTGSSFQRMAESGESMATIPVDGKRIKRSVWVVTPASYKEAHYAVFPPALVEPMILAGTSARGCCPICGSPWERVVEKCKAATTNPRAFSKPGNEGDCNDVGRIYEEMESHTIGWRPTCSCGDDVLCETCGCAGVVHEDSIELACPDCLGAGVNIKPFDPVPCLILDPFCGSGTTGMVAIKHGRDFVGLDLNGKYLRELATKRTDGIQKVLL